jgi:prepilin-type N-terminal cleavage/methylation domain-containing protein
MKTITLRNQRGFTLIELLTVMSIISILASMLLPSLGSAKEKARVIKCVSNFHQIGIAIEMYKHDGRDSRYPPDTVVDSDFAPKTTLYTLGGQDPAEPFQSICPSAKSRPLYPYLGLSEVFRCPRDLGQRILPCKLATKQKPSNWKTIGSSYYYNGSLPAILTGGGFKRGVYDLLPGQTESWVPDPSKFILMHEPPARAYGCTTIEWYQWHYSRQASDVSDVAKAPAFFYSPTLYVDGHSQMNNFSKALQTDIRFPYEETKNWIWYKPVKPPEIR